MDEDEEYDSIVDSPEYYEWLRRKPLTITYSGIELAIIAEALTAVHMMTVDTLEDDEDELEEDEVTALNQFLNDVAATLDKINDIGESLLKEYTESLPNS